ncbi:MAG: metal-dependent hydrolase [Acidilobaceae archaeon]
MPDLLTHYMVSYLVARALVEPRRALLLALVGLLPDVDALLLVHRWVTHSIPVALLASAPLLALTYAYRREYFGVAVLAVLLYTTHVVMDVFTGLTPIMWPLAPAIAVNIEVNGVYGVDGIRVTPGFEVVVGPVDFARRDSVEGPLVSETGLMLALVVALISLVEYTSRRLGVYRA